MSAFSFRTAKQTDLEPHQLDSDTAVDERPPVEQPADLASVVREKTSGRSRERVADRGVHPVLVPSLSELASSWRVGAMRASRDRYEDAVELWNAYLSLCPGDANAWFSLGQAALMASDTELASQAFLAVCERDPEHGLAHGALGYIASEHQFYDEAIERYRTAVACRPGCRDMLTELLRCQRLGGDTDGERKTLGQLAQLDQDTD